MAARGEYTVRVEGLRETTRALQRMDGRTPAAVLIGLKEAAAPVADDANSRLSKYQGIGPIKVRAAASGIFIQQSRRKKTGRRADFGALQMRVGLLPAAHEGEHDFAERVDLALEALILKEGLA